jgi:hypothetical protein
LCLRMFVSAHVCVCACLCLRMFVSAHVCVCACLCLRMYGLMRLLWKLGVSVWRVMCLYTVMDEMSSGMAHFAFKCNKSNYTCCGCICSVYAWSLPHEHMMHDSIHGACTHLCCACLHMSVSHNVCKCICLHTHMHVCKCMCLHAHMHVCKCMCLHAHMHVCKCICLHAHMHVQEASRTSCPDVQAALVAMYALAKSSLLITSHLSTFTALPAALVPRNGLHVVTR